MNVRHLGHTDFNLIIECFLEAFENYYVKMPTDHNYYRQRWKAAKVDYDLSYGMFDNDKLVGFIINAVDKRDGHHIAFNTGTGVIPSYRGKKIVKSIYEFAIPDLVKHGITKCNLEVIVENEKAIRAYKGIGFKIIKQYKCYSGELLGDEHVQSLKELGFEDINWQAIPNQDKYSWDFNRESLKGGNSRYYNVLNNGEIESFFSFNSENNTINQMEVFTTDNDVWERLFLAIQSVSKQVRIINVDDALAHKISAIENSGLKNTVNQYEMELILKH